MLFHLSIGTGMTPFSLRKQYNKVHVKGLIYLKFQPEHAQFFNIVRDDFKITNNPTTTPSATSYKPLTFSKSIRPHALGSSWFKSLISFKIHKDTHARSLTNT